jgi:hypothetical protein
MNVAIGTLPCGLVLHRSCRELDFGRQIYGNASFHEEIEEDSFKGGSRMQDLCWLTIQPRANVSDGFGDIQEMYQHAGGVIKRMNRLMEIHGNRTGTRPFRKVSHHFSFSHSSTS